MEDILLINLDDILHYTQMSGTIDVFKINPHILNSQILYLEPILGTDLYNKLLYLVDNDLITGSTYTDYNTLLINYITPSLVFHTIELFIPMNAYQIADGGTFQFMPTNAQFSPLAEIDKIAGKYRIIGQKYDDKLAMYLNQNSTLYPEFTTNEGLIKKTENTSRVGWYLGSTHSKSKIRI